LENDSPNKVLNDIAEKYNSKEGPSIDKNDIMMVPVNQPNQPNKKK